MVVHPDSNQISRVWSYSGTSKESFRFQIRGFHPLWHDFPVISPNKKISYSNKKPYNPGKYEYLLVWARPISLAATIGISFDFYSSGY